MWFTLMFYAGLPLRYLVILGVVGIIVISIGFPLLEEYQQARVLNFIFPDPNASYGDNFNVEQAKISIGSGGFLGMGYGHGSQVQLTIP